MSNFSPFYNLYGQQPDQSLPYGDMYRSPQQSPYAERLFPSAPGPQVPQQTPPQPSFYDAMSEVYNRQPGPAMSAYSKYLQQPPPGGQEFKPSKMRRLGAILAGIPIGLDKGAAAGFQASSSIANQPYEQGMQRYAMKGEQLQKAAGLENEMGKQQLATVKLIQDMKAKQADDDRQDMLADSLIKSRSVNMAKAISDIQNAGLHYQMDQTTGVLNIIRADGSMTPVGKFNPSTGEKTQSNREEEQFKSNLTEGRQKRNAILQSGLQQTNAVSMEGMRQQNRVALKETPSSTDKDKPSLVSPSAQRTALVDSTNEVLNDPKYSDLSKYIELNTAGYKINRPAAHFYNKQSDIDAINKRIADFEAEVKKRAEAKVNKRTGTPTSRYQQIK